MTKMTAEAIGSLILARQDWACTRLDENREYKFLREQQKQSEKMVEELYQCFDKNEQRSIRRHYEGEILLENFRLDEVYIQGLRDGFELIAFLSGRENGVRL